MVKNMVDHSAAPFMLWGSNPRCLDLERAAIKCVATVQGDWLRAAAVSFIK